MGKLVVTALLFIFSTLIGGQAFSQSQTEINQASAQIAAQLRVQMVTVQAQMDAAQIGMDQQQAQIYLKAAQQHMSEAQTLMKSGNVIEAATALDNANKAMNSAKDVQSRLNAAAAKGVESPCAPQETKAQSTCMIIDPYAKAQLDGVLAQATAMMQQGGTEKTCKAAKIVQAAAMGLNITHAGMCEAAISSCRSVCKTKIRERTGTYDPKLEAEAKLAQASLETCRGLESRVVASGMSAFNNMMSMAASAKCQKAVTTNTPTGTPPPGMDCSNEIMASNPVCICASNPANPVCTASNVGLGDGAFSSVGEGSGAVDGGGIKDPEFIGFDDEIGALASGGQGGGLGSGGGGGGGGMNGGSGAGALPPEEMGGAGAGPYNTDIMGGLTGGGGSGSSFGGGRGEGSGGGGGLFDSLAEKFNLKAFLPSKADFKNRGLASGSGADGITGPNGPSLFEKVSARYQKKQLELLP